MKRWFSSLLLVALALSATVVARGAAPASAHGGDFHVVNLQPDLADKLRAQGKTIKYPFPNSANRGKKFNPGGDTIPAMDLTGDQAVLVLFAKFSNTPPGISGSLPLSYFDDMLFSSKYDPPEYKAAGLSGYPTNRTLKNYYTEVSYGQVNIVTYDMPSTQGWLDVGHPVEYYATGDGVHDYGFGEYPHNALGLVEDVVKAADKAGVDFSKYARNGVLPNLFVVQAGGGAEWNLDPRLIWSHSWSLSDSGSPDLANGLVVDGVTVNNYAMMPAVGGDITAFYGPKSGPYPPTVGVFAHEYGHVLGLPDLYDYGPESEGVGNYSLMAGGSWNRYPSQAIFSGNSPAHMDAWSKYRLGFLKPIEITSAKSLKLPPAETQPVVYKMVVPFSNGKEYFLFENRQAIGFDQGFERFGAHGLAIYHVDDVVLTNAYWRPNEAENWKELRFTSAAKSTNGQTHYGVSISQADDRWDLEHGANRSDAGDLYPGAAGNTSFGSKSAPNSTNYYFWAGNDPQFGYSGVTVENIAEARGNITAKFSFQNP
jgi:immune inhibitor A